MIIKQNMYLALIYANEIYENKIPPEIYSITFGQVLPRDFLGKYKANNSRKRQGKEV